MNRKFRYLALASVILMLGAIFNPPPVAAQTGAMSAAEFREKFTAYALWLDNNTSPNQNLAMRVQAMSDEEFQVFYDSFADPATFISITEQIMMPAVQTEFLVGPQNSIQQNPQTAPNLFIPDYPFGWDYNNWIATLPGMNLLHDVDGDGYVNDRCTANGEAQIAIAGSTLKAAAIIADIACSADPTKLSCGAALLADEAVHANDIVALQCSSQGGSVDSAEIEATYENSVVISNQVSTHDTEIKALFAANHSEVLNLLAKNQAQLLKIEIEKELSVVSDNKRLSYFYLPQAQGGLLELVRQTVLDTITANQSAGMSIGNAQSWFNKAEASLAKRSYKAAYDLYKKAYLEAVK